MKLIPTQIKTKKHFDTFLVSKGFKKTRQRDIIAEIFFNGPHHHYRIEEILEHARKLDASISYATVYRTMMMFVEIGFAQQRQFGKGQSLFEVHGRHHHDHLICTQCKKIIEFENETIEKLQAQVAKRHGFKMTHHKMELYGTCVSCQK